MYDFDREVFLWKIVSWHCKGDSIYGDYSFIILVSPLFLKSARKAQFKKDKLQERARRKIREAGFNVRDYEVFLEFGEFGAIRFQVPGNACWLSMDIKRENLMEKGTILSTHNVDHAHQQSTLMALWNFWAKLVERQFRNI